LFDNYQTDGFFDEMFEANGTPRKHYERLFERFKDLTLEEFERKRAAVDLSFMRQGITFTVYNDNQGTERIFPFDLMPRIIPQSEWQRLVAGLEQRITALNLFVKDVYGEQTYPEGGVIPAPYVLGARHFRREFMGFKVPQGTSTSTFVEPTSSAAPTGNTSCSKTTPGAPPAFPTCLKTARPSSAPFRTSFRECRSFP
jgi:uncharacterized circularly permuted ATP-grasp superfamily protein